MEPYELSRYCELITDDMEQAGVRAMSGRLDPDWPEHEMARDVFVEMLRIVLQSPALRRKYSEIAFESTQQVPQDQQQ